MNKKILSKISMGIIYILCIMLIFSSCGPKVKKGSSSATDLQKQDYFPNSEESSSVDSIQTSSGNESKSNATSSKASTSNSTISVPIGKGDNEYPNTPGDPSTKKMPAFASKLANPVIKVLASYPLSDIDKERIKAFKAVTGVDLKLDLEITLWVNMTSTLATRVLAGNAPDMFTIGVETTPYLVRQKYFECIWDYINMNDGLWKDVKDINQIAFSGGKQYAAAVGGFDFTGRGIIYNKKLFDEAQLEYPISLYKKGAWNWDALYNAAKEITVDDNNDGNPEVMGASLANWAFGLFVNSTGADFIKYDSNGKIVNNLRDPRIQRAADFTKKIAELGIDKESWTWVNRFTQNKIGMATAQGVPDMISGPMLEMKKANLFGWVPFPKDPVSDKYYAQAQNYFTYIPKGAKNPQATAAWLYFQRYMAMNPSPLIEKQTHDIAINKWFWTEEEYQFMTKDISKQLSPIVGAGERVPDVNTTWLWDGPWINTWSKTLEGLNPSFQAAIDKFNNQ